jgi:hypothetical protein
MIKSQPQVKQWASKIEIKLFNSSPFSAIYYHGGSDGNFVEVHSKEVYSSDTLEQAEERLRNQLTRRIRDKISEGQFEQGSPFIIMVREDISNSIRFLIAILVKLERQTALSRKSLKSILGCLA